LINYRFYKDLQGYVYKKQLILMLKSQKHMNRDCWGIWVLIK